MIDQNHIPNKPARALMLAAMTSGVLCFGGPAWGDGGDPPGSAPVDWAAQRQAERSGLQTGDTRAAQRAAGASAAPRAGANNGDRSQRYYGNQAQRHSNQAHRNDRRYQADNRYRYNNRYRSYSYGDPYRYAPPPLAYDSNPTPGISLFFNF